MVSPFIKTISIFTETLYYYRLSLKKNADLLKLKKIWAENILNEFGFDLEIRNKSSDSSKIIFVGNHISFLDIIVLIAVDPRIVFLSKSEVARWPIIGAGAKRIGTVFVNRDCFKSRAKAKIKIAKKIKDSSEGICIAGFPSGTTSLSEDKPWKKGLFEIAQQADVPVQAFRLQYAPLRESAYIDQDNLLLNMARLFKTENKKVILEWGEEQMVSDPVQQSEELRLWTQKVE